MEDGDHSQCTVELLACSEHRDEQLRAMGYEPGTSNMPRRMDNADASMFTDSDGKPTVGFCLWCNCDFYSFEEMEAHNGNGSEACPVFQQFKGEQCMPPVLQAMLDDVGESLGEHADEEGEV
jgi:hypothetical protein